MQTLLQRPKLGEVPALQFSKRFFQLEHGGLNLNCCSFDTPQLLSHTNKQRVVSIDDVNQIDPDCINVLLQPLQQDRQGHLQDQLSKRLT